MQKGDRVICIDPDVSYGDLVLYNVYTVDVHEGTTIRIREKNGNWSKSRFYLPIYNIGDEVVCISPTEELEKDKVYKILDLSGDHGVKVTEQKHYFYPYRFLPLSLYKNKQPKMCPDCKGTGTYVGLFTIEKCKTCQG